MQNEKMMNVLDFCLPIEAGYQCDLEDLGNYFNGKLLGTNHGITPNVLYAALKVTPTIDTMKKLTKDQATVIYANEFWNKIRGDDLPIGIDLQIMDMQINSGINGGKCIQRVLNFDEEDIDGWIGNITINAIKNYKYKSEDISHISSDAVKILQQKLGLKQDGALGSKTKDAIKSNTKDELIVMSCLYRDARISSYRKDGGWTKYGKGWTNRANACLAKSLDMILA